MGLKYVAAALLAHYAGATPSMETIEKIVKEAGGEFDQSEAAKFVETLTAKGVAAAIEEGASKLSAVPAGVPAAGGAPAAAGGAEPKEEAKEEAKDEEEEDDDMGFSLFD